MKALDRIDRGLPSRHALSAAVIVVSGSSRPMLRYGESREWKRVAERDDIASSWDRIGQPMFDEEIERLLRLFTRHRQSESGRFSATMTFVINLLDHLACDLIGFPPSSFRKLQPGREWPPVVLVEVPLSTCRLTSGSKQNREMAPHLTVEVLHNRAFARRNRIESLTRNCCIWENLDFDIERVAVVHSGVGVREYSLAAISPGI
jgi:hypothetical protein